jgi:monoamine oxidase
MQQASGMRSYEPLPPATAPKTVLVVGAGMAGLTCAYELAQAGHRVTVLEARERPGGRVWTLRAPLTDGLLAEVGATFLPDNHPLPLHYAAAFGLSLVPLPATGRRPRYRVGDVNVPEGSGPPASWPVPLNSDECGLEPFALLARTVAAVVEQQGGWPAPTGSPGAWEPFDHLSLAELLRRQGLSEGARTLVQLTLLGNFGEGIESISALAAVRQVALQRGRTRSFAIVGGNDRLAQAFVDRLGGRVRLGTRVLGLTQDAGGVVVRTCTAGADGRAGESLEQADRVVLAVPTLVLARLAVSPGWGEVRAAALRRQRWTPATRVFLTVRRRFWPPDRSVMLAASDRPTVRWVIGPAPAGERDVLTAYVMGAAARELASLTPEGQAAWARAEAARVYPEWTEAGSAEAVSHCWDQDPFAGGGYPWPALGDDSLADILAVPEGRLHFAGDQTTHNFGWIQGAMESGLRAAHEVQMAA